MIFQVIFKGEEAEDEGGVRKVSHTHFFVFSSGMVAL